MQRNVDDPTNSTRTRCGQFFWLFSKFVPSFLCEKYIVVFYRKIIADLAITIPKLHVIPHYHVLTNDEDSMANSGQPRLEN